MPPSFLGYFARARQKPISRPSPNAARVMRAVLLVLVAWSGFGSAADSHEAQNLLNTYATRAQRAAVSAAIVRGDTLLWSGATGVANRARDIAASDNTAYLIASISKTVTATAVMQLVETRHLDLDEDINTYLPFTFRNPHQPRAIVTLRHLLTHTAGLRDVYYFSVAAYLITYYGDPKLSLADFCRAFFTPEGEHYYPATFTSAPPGTVFNYSNLGFALIGCIVEHAAGEPFDVFTERRIFAPLGMTRTSWRVADFRIGDMAVPYGPYGETYGHYTFPDYPNGGLRTTVKDFSKFLRAFMLGGTLEGQRVLEPTSVREMRRVQYPNVTSAKRQGLGWMGLEIGGGSKTFLGHSGGETGVSTLMAYEPITKAGAIIFTNGSVSSEADWNTLAAFFLALIKEGNNQISK